MPADSHMERAPVPAYRFTLFITGSAPRSTRAVTSIKDILERNLKGRYSLEIVDVYDDPQVTRDLQIIATPTLVKIEPGPRRYIVGDFSSEAQVLSGLELYLPPSQPGSLP